MRLSDIPIKHKLPVTIGIGLFLFCGAVLLYTLTLSKTIDRYEHLLSHEMAIRLQANRVSQQILQARRDEKDFFARKDTSLVAGVTDKINQAIEAARAVERLASGTSRWDEIQQQLELITHLQSYASQFQSLAKDWQERGLDFDLGQQKRFRDAAHAMEPFFTSQNEEVRHPSLTAALISYLTLRRLEKDYLLRQDDNYLVQVRQQAEILSGQVQQSPLTDEVKKSIANHLALYLTALNDLAALDQRIGQGMETMRQTIRQAEPLAQNIATLGDELATATALETRTFAEERARFIFILCVVTVLCCGLLSFFMVRSIVASISNLWHFSHKVAEGDLEATTTLDSRDEIGQLAVVMGDMVNRMRAMRLIADRMVLIMALAARGAIPDTLDAQLHGDFQKMCRALNEMIQRLRELRLITDHVDRISRGEIPERLAGPYQGDFKRMADAINTIIDKLHEMGGLAPQERFSHPPSDP